MITTVKGIKDRARKLGVSIDTENAEILLSKELETPELDKELEAYKERLSTGTIVLREAPQALALKFNDSLDKREAINLINRFASDNNIIDDQEFKIELLVMFVEANLSASDKSFAAEVLESAIKIQEMLEQSEQFRQSELDRLADALEARANAKRQQREQEVLDMREQFDAMMKRSEEKHKAAINRIKNRDWMKQR